jgi:hypothetical protein
MYKNCKQETLLKHREFKAESRYSCWLLVLIVNFAELINNQSLRMYCASCSLTAICLRNQGFKQKLCCNAQHGGSSVSPNVLLHWLVVKWTTLFANLGRKWKERNENSKLHWWLQYVATGRSRADDPMSLLINQKAKQKISFIHLWSVSISVGFK